MNINQNTIQTLLSQNQMAPPEGALTLNLLLDFSSLVAGDSFTFDMANYQTQGKFSIVQSIFIDNSLNTVALVVTEQTTGHVIVAAPHTQGWYNIVAQVPTRLNFSSQGGPAGVRIMISNMPIPGAVWAATHP